MSPDKEDLNPYVGPRPFERNVQDRARFFGRDRETQEIVSLIFGHPLVLVYAQSGAGKTSLFNAQVAPVLEKSRFEVLPLTRVRGVIPEGVKPQDIANLYVFNALLNLYPEADPQALVDKSLTTFLEERPRPTEAEGQPVPRVIIFDQFEELFTLYPKRWHEQQEAFFRQVTEALAADPLLRIVFVIREDYLAQLDPFARLLPERLRTRLRLERLREDAALLAVEKPLSNAGRAFAPGVAESLVKELMRVRAVSPTGEMTEVEGQYVEPVQLQVVCLMLWSSLPPKTEVISQAHLKKFGDVNRALSNFYEDAIRAATKDTDMNETTLRAWCEQKLITPMGTRGTVCREKNTTGGIPNAAVDVLENLHLIRGEWRAGARWYELTHDRFVEPIQESNKIHAIEQRKQKTEQTQELLKQALSSINREAGDWAGKAATFELLEQTLVKLSVDSELELARTLFDDQAQSIRIKVSDGQKSEIDQLFTILHDHRTRTSKINVGDHGILSSIRKVISRTDKPLPSRQATIQWDGKALILNGVPVTLLMRAAMRGNKAADEEIHRLLDQLAQIKGWRNLAAALGRVLAGERDAEALAGAHNLDRMHYLILVKVLEALD